MSGISAVYRPVRSVCGPAVTVSVPAGGFSMVKLALEQCRDGDILIVAAKGNTTHALWGGNLSLGAQRRGLAAVIVDGAIRDADDIRALDFPVFAAGIATSADPINVPFGETNVPVACGRIVVHSGDLIVADGDGIVCVRPGDVDAVAAATIRVIEGHHKVMPQLERGEITTVSGIAASMREAGLSDEPNPYPGTL
jgi:regulator of RNase E activity RraA